VVSSSLPPRGSSPFRPRPVVRQLRPAARSRYNGSREERATTPRLHRRIQIAATPESSGDFSRTPSYRLNSTVREYPVSLAKDQLALVAKVAPRAAPSAQGHNLDAPKSWSWKTGQASPVPYVHPDAERGCTVFAMSETLSGRFLSASSLSSRLHSRSFNGSRDLKKGSGAKGHPREAHPSQSSGLRLQRTRLTAPPPEPRAGRSVDCSRTARRRCAGVSVRHRSFATRHREGLHPRAQRRQPRPHRQPSARSARPVRERPRRTFSASFEIRREAERRVPRALA